MSKSDGRLMVKLANTVGALRRKSGNVEDEQNILKPAEILGPSTNKATDRVSPLGACTE